MGKYILGLTGNREESIGIPTNVLSGDIDALSLLLSTVTHTGFDQDVIKNYKEGDDDYFIMTDVMSTSKYTVWIRILWTSKSPMRRRIICRRPRSN